VSNSLLVAIVRAAGYCTQQQQQEAQCETANNSLRSTQTANRIWSTTFDTSQQFRAPISKQSF